MNRPGNLHSFPEVKVLRMGVTASLEQDTVTPIREGAIHVWSARYSTLERYYPCLSERVSRDEMRKAAGFIKHIDARRYILRHGMVRTILGRYTHEAPETLRFIHGTTGKPDLDPDSKFPDIRFSLSRTDERVCLVITRKSEIGVDIVRPQNHYSFPAIENYLFTPGEQRWAAQAVSGKRSMRFFRIWALKEAILKATGGDVRIMKEADLSCIMTDTFLDGFYSINIGKKHQNCFIRESGCGTGHHCALATVPEYPESRTTDMTDPVQGAGMPAG